jgi:hypothetical protein
MRLKQHREDVKWLRSWPKEHYAARLAREIADRYQWMILAFEEFENGYFIPDTKKMNRVLTDGKGNKRRRQ